MIFQKTIFWVAAANPLLQKFTLIHQISIKCHRRVVSKEKEGAHKKIVLD